MDLRPGAFAASRRFAANVFVGPAQAFIQTEASGGIVLLIAAAAALAWANSPWDQSYHDLWDAHLSLDLNLFAIDETLGHLVNDGLMTVFFFVVGLEIKRELLHGELASPRKAALPVAAAIGGMAVPALIYAAFNAGGDGQAGWGIPMATDIAFALGVLALLGRRAPFSLKVFLLALAIVDDLAAIGVIAVFYTESLSMEAVFWALAVIAIIVAANRAGMRSVDVYVALGAVLWMAMLKTGIHATLTGVFLAMLTPSRPYYDEEGFETSARGLIERFRRHEGDGEHAVKQDALLQMERLSRDSASPLDRLEHLLHPWVSYLIMPVFALANAGIPLSGGAISDAASSDVTLGVVGGLVIGKPLGIFAAAWLACRFGLAQLPENTGYSHILGAGLLGGIGFTVSIFIAGLAFDSEALVSDAKMGILAASAFAGIVGFIFLWVMPGEPNLASESASPPA
ncbi:MAG: Na+/H+ antiporter NhaA [Anaerolinea sp.]|nr:Na+/H+ antiporter NhaA [Anaerolinea sp.]